MPTRPGHSRSGQMAAFWVTAYPAQKKTIFMMLQTFGSTRPADPLFSLPGARLRAWISVWEAQGGARKCCACEREKRGSCWDICDMVPRDVTLETVEEWEREKMSMSINCQRGDDWMLVVRRVDQYLPAGSGLLGCGLQGPRGFILLHSNYSLPVTHLLHPFC